MQPRWNITVPKAGGRVSAFVGRVTNNTFALSGDRVRPIENRDIVSRSDWFMAGLRAEANLGAHGVRLGALPEFTMPLPRVGFNYVNRFFTNYDLTRTNNPLRGVTIANPPPELYLRFSDASPENPGGAKVFRVRVFVDDALEYDIIGGRETARCVAVPKQQQAGRRLTLGRRRRDVYLSILPVQSAGYQQCAF